MLDFGSFLLYIVDYIICLCYLYF